MQYRRLCFVALLLLASVAHGQINFRNLTDRPVRIALAVQSTDGAFSGWIVRGWDTCIPNATINLLPTLLHLNANIYYYAESDSKIYDGDKKFLIDTSASTFKIMNADLAYQRKENQVFRNFMKVNTRGRMSLDYTIELKPERWNNVRD